MLGTGHTTITGGRRERERRKDGNVGGKKEGRVTD